MRPDPVSPIARPRSLQRAAVQEEDLVRDGPQGVLLILRPLRGPERRARRGPLEAPTKVEAALAAGEKGVEHAHIRRSQEI